MLRYKLIVLSFLSILIIFLLNYLSQHQNQEITYFIKDNLLPFVNVDDSVVEIYQDEIYNPINHLEIYSKSKYNSKYTFNNQKYNITISNNFGNTNVSFNIAYKPKEIVEIIKEVYIEKEIEPIESYIDKRPSNVNNDPYVDGIKDIDLRIDSDIHELNYLLSKDIKTNCQLTIDYSEVNLSKVGKYKVYYYANDKEYHCYVNIY